MVAHDQYIVPLRNLHDGKDIFHLMKPQLDSDQASAFVIGYCAVKG